MMARKRRVNPGCVVLLVICILSIAAVIIVTPYVKEFFDTKSSYDEAVTVTIPEGSSGEDIAGILKENGLIKSELIFRVKAKMSDNGTKMNYGTFNLYKGMCIPDIIDTLAGTYAYRETVRLTIPEGYSVEQIGVRCEELGLFTKEEFFAALDADYGVDLPDDENVKYAIQGYLYPETYEFYLDAEPKDVIATMVSQFKKEMKEAGIKMGKDFNKTLTIASLIEREALLDSEMETISGVIKNRLEKGMRLQIDAAVQYAVSDGYYDVNRIKYSDLEIDSPYNTYRIDALPAGPICNPSVKAIKAAKNPEKHKYLYYHTDTVKNDGSHIFTKTYEEHINTQ